MSSAGISVMQVAVIPAKPPSFREERALDSTGVELSRSYFNRLSRLKWKRDRPLGWDAWLLDFPAHFLPGTRYKKLKIGLNFPRKIISAK